MGQLSAFNFNMPNWIRYQEMSLFSFSYKDGSDASSDAVESEEEDEDESFKSASKNPFALLSND